MSLWTRLQERKTDPMVATTGQLIMASLYMWPIALLIEQPWTLRLDPLGAHLPAVISLVILAVFGTSLAYLLYYWLIARVGATQTSLVTYIFAVYGDSVGRGAVGRTAIARRRLAALR